MSDVVAAAFHEAGHAFGYARQHDAVLRSVSIDREGNGLTRGSCRGVDLPKISALGPIAEAVWELNTSHPDECYDFRDLLTAQLMTGTCAGDYPDARDVLNSHPWTDWLRSELVSCWAGVERLALALVERGTVPGAEAAELLR